MYPEGPATGHLYTGFFGFLASSSSKLLLHAPHAALPVSVHPN
jgi:hypothetical protein